MPSLLTSSRPAPRGTLCCRRNGDVMFAFDLSAVPMCMHVDSRTIGIGLVHSAAACAFHLLVHVMQRICACDAESALCFISSI